jgi:hypothetical protein
MQRSNKARSHRTAYRNLDLGVGKSQLAHPKASAMRRHKHKHKRHAAMRKLKQLLGCSMHFWTGRFPPVPVPMTAPPRAGLFYAAGAHPFGLHALASVTDTGCTWALLSEPLRRRVLHALEARPLERAAQPNVAPRVEQPGQRR